MTGVRVTDVTKSFGRTQALAGVSFTAGRGVTGLLGPNGAGKTTLLRMLATVLAPDGGSLQLLGRDPQRSADRLEIRRRLGYLPQEPGFHRGFTVFEFVDYVAILKELTDRRARHDEVRRVIDLVGLSDVSGRRIRALSGGMKRRVGVAQAVLGDPELVVLDEPMTGLDPIGRKEIRDLILELGAEGKTVFFSTHILPDVESTCDRVAIVAGGKLRNIGPLASLLSARLLTTEVVVRPAAGTDVASALPPGARRLPGGGGADVALELPPEQDVAAFLRAVLGQGAEVVSVTPRRESLEDLFVREAARGAQDAAAPAAEARAVPS